MSMCRNGIYVDKIKHQGGQFRLDLSESIDVRLMFRATGAMSINGNFQP